MDPQQPEHWSDDGQQQSWASPQVSPQLKTLEANVVKSLFAVLGKLSLKVLQCHRRQTKRFFRNFLAIFCVFGASNGTCQVWCKLRHKWPNYGQKTI